MQREQQGFTLIELVIVIVILGILSAFALPRFADLSGDAETAAVEGALGSVKSAASIVRSKALASGNGDESSDGAITLEGQSIDLENGYLAATSVEEAAQLGDYTIEPAASGDPSVVYVTVVDATDGSPCFSFTESSAANTPPDISDVIEQWDTGASDCTP